MCNHFEKLLGSIIKVAHRHSLRPNSSFHDIHIPNRNAYKCLPKDMHKNVLATLFVVTKSWKQLSYISVVE